MRQVRVARRHRPGRDWLEPLPPDARDPDIVHVKQLARRAARLSRRHHGPGKR